MKVPIPVLKARPLAELIVVVLFCKALALPNSKVPPETSVAPVKVLVPVSVHVLVLLFVRATVPTPLVIAPVTVLPVLVPSRPRVLTWLLRPMVTVPIDAVAVVGTNDVV